MSSQPSEATYQNWHDQIGRRGERRVTSELLASAIAGFILQGALFVQFAFGALRDKSYSADVADALLVTLGIGLVALLITPRKVGMFYRFMAQRVGRKIFSALAILILTALYLVVLMPAGRIFGRRAALARHPQLRSWVNGAPWRMSGTWVAKKANHDAANTRSQGTVVRLISFLVAQRNWFIVVVALLLLLLTSVLMLANSPVVAPFIYTLV
jgi:hypothetical protein